MPSVNNFVELFNGYKMPIVGLGTMLGTTEQMELAIETAVNVGYRHFDTAYLYKTEKGIGNALQKLIKANQVKREDLFIVTKLPPNAMRAAEVDRFLKMSLSELQLDYVDLYLVHTPIGLENVKDDEIFPIDSDGNALLDVTTDHLAVWKKMEEQVDLGLARSIGLSNFNERQIQRILDNARIRPANLQVECNLYFQQRKLVEFCHSNRITVTAYAPFGSPGISAVLPQSDPSFARLLDEPKLKTLMEKYKKTAAQILIRCMIERNVAVIPQSTNPGRIAENFNVFDFEFSAGDTKVLDGLDRNLRLFDLSHWKGARNHPEFPYDLESPEQHVAIETLRDIIKK